MRIVWALMLCGAAMAGCAEEPAVEQQDEEAFGELDAQATEDTGVIRGIVVDPSITPVQGAIVTVIGPEMETTTNENGAFVFEGIEPGSHFLKAAKPGFSEVQQSVEVRAGVDTPPIVKIQLVPDATTQPFIQAMVYDAYIQCSESLVLVGYSGGCSNDFLVEYGPGELGRTPDFAQSEMVWESTQPLGDWMNVMYSSAPLPGETLLHNYVEDEGASPLTIQANQTLMESKGVINEWPLMVRIFNSGLEGTDIGRDYGDPRDGDNCVERPALGGCTTGVGATIDQVLTVYSHAFFNVDPDLEWRFLEDGPYPL